MANDFTDDVNCISLWQFEEGLMLTDTLGNNTLTYSNPSWKPIEDTTIYKEGDCSAKWNDGLEEPYTIDDGDLSAGFPLKNGGATTFSWAAWIYPTLGASDHYSFGKMNDISVDTAFYLKYTTSTWAFSAAGNETDSGLAAVNDTWHHVAVTYDGVTDQLTIRVYHENTGLTDSYQTTLTGGDVVVAGTQPWMIGDPNFRLTVRIDELAVFDDVLTPAEIDEIRAGTFGDGGGGGATGQSELDAYTALNLGCAF